MKTLSAWVVLLLFSSATRLLACNAALVAGSATPDGRPLLWKSRDTKQEANDLRAFRGEPFDFIGMVDTRDTTGSQVWMGVNSAGFAIMNTNALNLPKGDYSGKMDQDGYLMKQALSTCATLQDFERILGNAAKPWGVQANFGAFDARGGIAFYEVMPGRHEKFDVADPKVAPHGYLLRTNFGFTGAMGEGDGYIRFETLESLFFRKRQTGPIGVDFILFEAGRCLRNSLLHTDLRRSPAGCGPGGTDLIPFCEYIIDYSTASGMVVQGVRPGENPNLTTLWCIPAFPLACPSIPLWVGVSDSIPSIAKASEGNPSFLTQKALAIKHLCFPLAGRDGRFFIDTRPLLNDRDDGMLQRILRRDAQTLELARPLLEQWRSQGFNPDEARKFLRTLEEEILLDFSGMPDAIQSPSPSSLSGR